jgi:predicted GNAT family acetyltransferase
MYFVQFNAPRFIHYSDPNAFVRRAQRWLTMREGENSYFLGLLPNYVSQGPQPGCHFFTVEEDNAVVAAGTLSKIGTLIMSWAPHETFDVIADYASNARWKINHVSAPAHVAFAVAKAYADRTRQIVEIGRSERIYQLTRSHYALPEQGRLEVATQHDQSFVKEWVAGFVAEAGFESNGSIDEITHALIAPRLLYLWKSPQPVAMAAWVGPTPNGASLNFVYTPPEYRGQGYGKVVSAALASQMLASGLRYCFILTDNNDSRTNGLYQSIGARTLCEFLRCAIRPRQVPAHQASHANGILI